MLREFTPRVDFFPKMQRRFVDVDARFIAAKKNVSSNWNFTIHRRAYFHLVFTLTGEKNIFFFL